LALQFLDLKSLMRNQGVIVGGLGSRHCKFGRDFRASTRSAMGAAFSASMLSRSESRAGATSQENHKSRSLTVKKCSNKQKLSRGLRAKSMNRVPQINAFEHVSELRAEISMTPSVGVGHANLLRSRLLA
jgi:hypothetical protein